MQVLYSPQRNDSVIDYEFQNDTITVTYQGQSEMFDFSTMPDGTVVNEIETSLPINPIVRAERTDGVLSVVLLKFHGKDATENELYPEWVTV